MQGRSKSYEKLIGTFQAARDLVVGSGFPQLGGITFQVGCPAVEQYHRESPRGYMHVLHVPNVICVAAAAEDLGRQTLLGLWLHEFGHVLGGPEQWDADEWVFRNIKLEGHPVPIRYDERDLQFVEL